MVELEFTWLLLPLTMAPKAWDAGYLEMPEKSRNVPLSKEVNFSVYLCFGTVCIFRHPLGLGAQSPIMREG